MDAARNIVWLTCFLAWILWLPTASLAVASVLRGAVASGSLTRRGLLVCALVPLALLAMWFLLPFPYGASTAANLTDHGPTGADFYKGAADRALIAMLAPGTRLGAFGIMVVSRAHVLPLAFIGLAVLAARDGSARALSTERDRIVWLLLLLCGPGVMLGLSNGKYYGAIPLAMSTLLLALEARRTLHRWITVILISTSLWLVALSRPESVFVSALVAVYLLTVAIRERDRVLAGALTLVLLLLCAPLLEAAAFLEHAVRYKPLLMGSDTLGTAPRATVVLSTVWRAVARIPLSVAGLVVASAGLACLAAMRAAVAARDRTAIGARLAAAYLVIYVVAIAVHQDGFGAWPGKYNLIAAVPVWFLATGALETPHVRRHSRWYRASALALAAAASIAWIGFCALARPTNVRQNVLDLQVAPRMAAIACRDRNAALITFQTMDGEGERANLFTDRSPLDEFGVLLEIERLCDLRPHREEKHWYVGRRGYDPMAFLCAAEPTGRRDTRAVVSLRSGMSVAQLLADTRNCGWSEGLSFGNVALLVRTPGQ